MIRWLLPGEVKGCRLPTLLRRRSLRHGTCRLSCERSRPDRAAELWLESGWVVHARYGSSTGFEAMRSLLSDSRLRFELERHLPVPARTLHVAAEEVLDMVARPRGVLVGAGMAPGSRTP